MQTAFREHALINQWPAAATYDYLLAAQPNAGVRAAVMEEKYLFNNQYRQGLKDILPPDIPIAGFTAREAMENTLIRWMSRLIAEQETFIVTLNNFGGMPGQAIYLRVQEQQPFIKLMQGMKPISEFLESNQCPPLQLYPMPCIPIALGLQQEIYEKAMSGYISRRFSASFPVHQLALIRRNSDGAFRQIQAFGLMPARNNQYAA